jgi:SAM-dependent methyltransferase
VTVSGLMSLLGRVHRKLDRDARSRHFWRNRHVTYPNKAGADINPWVAAHLASRDAPTKRFAKDLLLRNVPHGAIESVLDLGCNIGNAAHLFEAIGIRRYTGVDINACAIDYARNEMRFGFDSATFICADIAEEIGWIERLLTEHQLLYTSDTLAVLGPRVVRRILGALDPERNLAVLDEHTAGRHSEGLILHHDYEGLLRRAFPGADIGRADITEGERPGYVKSVIWCLEQARTPGAGA